jgi:hypothetical protein
MKLSVNASNIKLEYIIKTIVYYSYEYYSMYLVNSKTEGNICFFSTYCGDVFNNLLSKLLKEWELRYNKETNTFSMRFIQKHSIGIHEIKVLFNKPKYTGIYLLLPENNKFYKVFCFGDKIKD